MITAAFRKSIRNTSLTSQTCFRKMCGQFHHEDFGNEQVTAFYKWKTAMLRQQMHLMGTLVDSTVRHVYILSGRDINTLV